MNLDIRNALLAHHKFLRTIAAKNKMGMRIHKSRQNGMSMHIPDMFSVQLISILHFCRRADERDPSIFHDDCGIHNLFGFIHCTAMLRRTAFRRDQL